MNIDHIKETYIAESSELLQQMESILLEIEGGEPVDKSINELFRAVHTIKGTSGIFGFQTIVDFTHIVENLLDNVREGKITLIGDSISLLLECRDHISDLVELVASDSPLSDEKRKTGILLVDRLQEILNPGNTPKVKAEIQTEQTQKNELPKKSIQLPYYYISLRFYKDVLKNGLDPYSFIKYLKQIGNIKNLVTVTSQIPSLEDLDPEECYVGFEILLESTADKTTVENVFEFLQSDSVLKIFKPNPDIEEFVDFIRNFSEDTNSIRNLLTAFTEFPESSVEEIIALTKKPPEKAFVEEVLLPENEDISMYVIPKVGESLPSLESLSQHIETAGSLKQNNESQEGQFEEKKGRDISKDQSKSIRIEAEKLDHLINLVGELVIAGSNISQLSVKNGDPEITESSYIMSRLIAEIRDSALRIRMVQIGSTFTRFQRVVRDIGMELNKEIRLNINGGETELDKTVIEKIADPLMHIVRNAIDHGIEKSEERLQNGKPAYGNIWFNAYHDTGSIVIEVKDDGKGFSKEKILAKAIEKGLASPGQNLNDKEIYDFVFSAGFSTADQITNISGRGVGLDVVKGNIESLRGTVAVESKEGEGTTFRIRLPLTLAIIDGFLVKVRTNSYVIPLDMVVECIETDEEQTSTMSRRNCINLRGELLPFVRITDLFAFKMGESEANIRNNIVVVQWGGKKAGLLVDRLFGEIQTVIKPLGRIFDHLKGVSGSTILGSGEVALILDIPSLLTIAQIAEFNMLENTLK